MVHGPPIKMRILHVLLAVSMKKTGFCGAGRKLHRCKKMQSQLVLHGSALDAGSSSSVFKNNSQNND